MRCMACDVVLTDFEATRKYHGTDKHIDLCNDCFYTTGIYHADIDINLMSPADEVPWKEDDHGED